MAEIIIITGAVNSGKTSLAEKMYREEIMNGKAVAGFITEAEYTEERKTAYYLRNLAGGERVLAVSADKRPGYQKMRQYDFSRYYFNEAAFKKAGRILTALTAGDDIRHAAPMVFIDEMGPLEIAGGGFRTSVSELLANFSGTVVIVIRDAVLDEMARSLDISLDEADVRYCGV